MNKPLMLLLTVISLLQGCTTTKTLAPENNLLAEKLQEGDRILIHQYSGPTIDVQFLKINEESLTGISAIPPYKSIEIALHNISSVEKETAGILTKIGFAGAMTLIVPMALLGGAVGVDWD